MCHPDNGNLLAISCLLLILPVLARSSTEKPLGHVDPTKVRQLSWHPRIFLYEGFLKPEECDHLINLARDKLGKSMVVDDETGQAIESKERTSTGTFLFPAQDETVANIEARIAAWTMLPPENGEQIQILRYENGQKYDPHFDYFQDEKVPGGHRVATVLMYLTDVVKGGETMFPASHKAQGKDDGSLSDCAKGGGYAVKPKKGDSLFFNRLPNATTDPSSFHGSCPVVEGEKWSATRWIHVRSFA